MYTRSSIAFQSTLISGTLCGGYITVMLTRYVPGTLISKHRHTTVEHIFVLEGMVEEVMSPL